MLKAASFHLPIHVDLDHPAWLQHIPFLATVLQVQRPATFVELGVHTGNSYFAACNTVARLGLSTSCAAVDTWQGDEHAGFYGEGVFEQVQAKNAEFPFSELVRGTFEEVVANFDDRSVDLIHFDGRHYYRDIKADFEVWLPKLSDRSIALLHDIHVYANDFGVAAYWAELKQAYPTFEFFHGHGLGVVLVGNEPNEEVAQWFAELGEDPPFARNAFYRLGEAVQDHFEVLARRALGDCSAEVEAARAENVELRTSLERSEEEYQRLASEIDALMMQYRAAVRERDDLGGSLNVLRDSIQQPRPSDEALSGRDAHLTDLEHVLWSYHEAVRERDELRGTTGELRAHSERMDFELMRIRSRRSVRCALALAARFRWLFRILQPRRG